MQKPRTVEANVYYAGSEGPKEERFPVKFFSDPGVGDLKISRIVQKFFATLSFLFNKYYLIID